MKGLPLLCLCLLFLCGCSLFDPLPPGKAPEGPLVRNQIRRDFDMRSAVNYMTTSLSIYLLTEPLKGNAVFLDCDAATQSAARKVLEELAPVTGLKEKSQAPPVLKTRLRSGGWEFSLSDGRKILWKERLELALCRPTKEK